MTRRAQIFFLLYVCVVAYLSLFPGDFLLHPRMDRLVWYPVTGRRQILDAGLNVLFYVPLGVAGVWSFRRRAIGWPITVMAGIALSALIEYLQRWAPTRYATLDDLAANSLGTILGATLAVVVDVPALRIPVLSGRAGVLLTLWFLWHAFPFMPKFSMLQLQQIVNPTPWSWVTFVEVLLGACALGVALRDPLWRMLAFAAIPAQTFLLYHGLSYAALAGGVIGFAAAGGFKNRATQVLGWALTLWLLVEEFRPFALRPPVAFVWAPFATWYQSSSGKVYPVIFGKLFLYTATVWFLKKRGLRWWQAVGIPALILVVGETAQRWIEGRTPESTDVVLVAAGAILLRLAGNERLEAGQFAVERQERQVESR